MSHIATGYLSGTASYKVDNIDDTAKKVREMYFKQTSLDEQQVDEMKAIIEYIIRYNDDNAEIYSLIHDLLEFGACYEVLHEEDNEIIYHNFDALNTVAIWDTHIPSNLLAICSKYTVQDRNNNTYDIFRVVDETGMKVYNRTLGDLPVEDTSKFESKF